MRIRSSIVAAASVLLATGAVGAGERPPLAEPVALVIPLAAGFLPKIGAIHAGEDAAGAVYALGGEGRPSFAVVSGRLPEGVSLAGDGRLVGPVLAPGTFTATVRVGDAGGQATEVALDLVVLPESGIR